MGFLSPSLGLDKLMSPGAPVNVTHAESILSQNSHRKSFRMRTYKKGRVGNHIADGRPCKMLAAARAGAHEIGVSVVPLSFARRRFRLRLLVGHALLDAL